MGEFLDAMKTLKTLTLNEVAIAEVSARDIVPSFVPQLMDCHAAPLPAGAIDGG
jgi:hypothetical protein